MCSSTAKIWQVYKQYIIALICYLVFIIVGGITFALIEDISYIDGLYFTVVTQSTVGYGDITPQTDMGQLFNFFYVLLSFFFIIILFQFVVDYWFDQKINVFIDKARSMSPRKNAELDEKANRRFRFFVYLTIYLTWLIIWVTFFTADSDEEELSFFKAVYFAVITSTTVGYGWYSPKTDEGKIFCFFLINVGVELFAYNHIYTLHTHLSIYIFADCMQVVSLAVVLEVVSETVMDLINKCVVDEKKLKGHSKELFKLINENNVTTKAEFIVHWLQENNHISDEIYNEAVREFEKHDIDGSGVLDLRDVQKLATIEEIDIEEQQLI